MSASNAGMVAHWFLPKVYAGGICEEYVTGDDVLDHTNGNPSDVDCPDCLEWVHA
ncbi:MAG: hypothetical protein JWP31_1817 [Aeromicrobium sp.]|nr:hypothetical protein [Aeromicrobium sp.]